MTRPAAICALTACLTACAGTDLHVRPPKAQRLAEDFSRICLAHPRDDAAVRAEAAARAVPVEPTPAARFFPKHLNGVRLNAYDTMWSCMIVRPDPDASVTSPSLTAALDRWPDGELIRWQDAEPRGASIGPLLHFAERQLGRDTHTVRANRLRGDLVYHFQVSPGP